MEALPVGVTGSDKENVGMLDRELEREAVANALVVGAALPDAELDIVPLGDAEPEKETDTVGVELAHAVTELVAVLLRVAVDAAVKEMVPEPLSDALNEVVPVRVTVLLGDELAAALLEAEVTPEKVRVAAPRMVTVGAAVEVGDGKEDRVGLPLAEEVETGETVGRAEGELEAEGEPDADAVPARPMAHTFESLPPDIR